MAGQGDTARRLSLRALAGVARIDFLEHFSVGMRQAQPIAPQVLGALAPPLQVLEEGAHLWNPAFPRSRTRGVEEGSSNAAADLIVMDEKRKRRLNSDG